MARPVEAWRPWEPDAKNAWNLKWAGHLFRRAGFGANYSELREAIRRGLPATLELAHQQHLAANFAIWKVSRMHVRIRRSGAHRDDQIAKWVSRKRANQASSCDPSCGDDTFRRTCGRTSGAAQVGDHFAVLTRPAKVNMRRGDGARDVQYTKRVVETSAVLGYQVAS